MTSLKFIILFLSIGLIGWGGRFFFFTGHNGKTLDRNHSQITPQKAFVIFLGGFGTCSLVLFAFAAAGYFTARAFFIFFFLLLAFYIFKNRKVILPSALFHYLGIIFLFSVMVIGFGKIVKPFEAITHSSDAAAYVSASYHLADTGNLTYQDRLVQEMTEEERGILFRNLIENRNNTKVLARFPSRIFLLNPQKGLVTFSFYPLFSVWLGLGNLFLGDFGFLYIVSLFGFISLTSLYFIGKEIGNSFLGFSLVLVFLFFYPQVYFSSMPLTEIAAQAFFLAGSLIFFGAYRESILSKEEQLLVGILWGSSFLCRMENMAFILISLTLAFSLIPLFRNNIYKWRHFLLCLVGFSLLSLYYQLTHGIYAGDLSRIFNETKIFHFLALFSIDYPVTFNIVFLFLSVVIILLFFLLLLRPPSPRSILIIRTSGLMLLGIFIIWITSKFYLRQFIFTSQWLIFYTSPGIFILLLAGAFFFLHDFFQNKNSPRILMLLIIFGLSTFWRLVYPWIEPIQPWAIRRFVPIIFPLFFIFAFSGLFLYQDRVKKRYRIPARIVFSIIIFLITASFFQRSKYIFQQTPFINVIFQIKSLANKIPKNALVIIPYSKVGLETELPLRYMEKRDVIMLPHDTAPNEEYLKTMVSYLNRQLNKNRPILFMTTPTATFPGLLTQNFYMDFLTDSPVSFSTILQFKNNQFPDHSTAIVLDYYIFNLEQKKQLSNDFSINIGNLKKEINFNLEGFYAPEGTVSIPEKSFRWTANEARLLLPQVSSFTLFVSGSRPHEAEKGELKIEVNGVILKKLTLSPGVSKIQIDIPDTLKNKSSPLEVRMTCNTFSPKKLGLSLDSRNLGFQLFKINLKKNKLSTAQPGAATKMDL